jgi:hypothetical protein
VQPLCTQWRKPLRPSASSTKPLLFFFELGPDAAFAAGERSDRARSWFLSRFAREPQSPQFLSAVTKLSLCRIIFCGRFWSISFLILACFEKLLSARKSSVFT